jgi:hypothetical protein
MSVSKDAASDLVALILQAALREGESYLYGHYHYLSVAQDYWSLSSTHEFQRKSLRLIYVSRCNFAHNSGCVGTNQKTSAQAGRHWSADTRESEMVPKKRSESAIFWSVWNLSFGQIFRRQFAGGLR